MKVKAKNGLYYVHNGELYEALQFKGFKFKDESRLEVTSTRLLWRSKAGFTSPVGRKVED